MFLLVVALGAVGLLLSAARGNDRVVFSAEVAANGAPVVLARGEKLCQGPLTIPVAFNGVAIWARSSSGSGGREALDASIRAAEAAGAPRGADATVLRGPSTATARGTTTQLSGTFPTSVRANQAVTLCLSTRSRIALQGGSPSHYSGALRDKRRPQPAALAMLFLDRSTSTLSLIPTIFRRASLFRPSWIGPWLYWLLVAVLAGATAWLALRLIPTAAEEDDSSRGSATLGERFD